MPETARIVEPVNEQNRLQISWTNSAGAALGAVSSAVLLSSLGAAGTLIGAALGSLCITIGGAVYAHYLSITKERVAAQALAARRPARVRERVPVGAGAAALSRADEQEYAERQPLTERHPVLDSREEGRPADRATSGLPWKRIVAVSAVLFGMAMALILSFELTTGRAVSTYTGGTSNTGVGTSLPGWSGTGEESTELEVDVPLPQDTLEGKAPQDKAPQDDAPQEEAPRDEAPQEEAPQDDAPQPAAPQEEAPQEAPQEETPVEPAPAEPAPAEPAPAEPGPAEPEPSP